MRHAAPPPLRRWRLPDLASPGAILAIVLATFLARMIFVCFTQVMSGDEVDAVAGTTFARASTFLRAGTASESWAVVEALCHGGRGGAGGGARPFWMAGHLLWGVLLPNDGRAAWGLPGVVSTLAIGALALAARNLFGRTGFLFAILFASLSPLLMNYEARVIATMPATFWICASLAILSGSDWRAPRWFAGGACFGLAFGTHYGAGIAILSIAAGLAVSMLARTFGRGATLEARAAAWVLQAPAGVFAAVVPLVLLEVWAREGNSSYFAELFKHGNLGGLREPGATGLWLRQLFELEPLAQTCLVALLAGGLASRGVGLPAKLGLAALAIAAGVVLAPSLQGAPIRAILSLALFGGIGLAIGLASGPARSRDVASEAPEPEAPEPSRPRGPFTPLALVVATATASILLTLEPALSEMPRLVFPCWPLLVLALAGLVARMAERDPRRAARTIRLSALVGVVVFTFAWGTFVRARGELERQGRFLRAHPSYESYDHLNFCSDSYYPRFLGRSNPDVEIFAPPSLLYPAWSYEEEPFKRIDIDGMLLKMGADGLFTGDEISGGSVCFEVAQADPSVLPPSGSPYRVENAMLEDVRGRSARAWNHETRGLELAFPASDSPEPRTVRATIPLSIRPDALRRSGRLPRRGPVGFEFQAVAPNLPPGARLELRVVFDGIELARGVPVATTPGVPVELFQHDAPLLSENPMLRIEATLVPGPPREDPRTWRNALRKFGARFGANAKDGESADPGSDAPPATAAPRWSYTPPAAIYVRRPFVDVRPALAEIAAEAEAIRAPEGAVIAGGSGAPEAESAALPGPGAGTSPPSPPAGITPWPPAGPDRPVPPPANASVPRTAKTAAASKSPSAPPPKFARAIEVTEAMPAFERLPPVRDPAAPEILDDYPGLGDGLGPNPRLAFLRRFQSDLGERLAWTSPVRKVSEGGEERAIVEFGGSFEGDELAVELSFAGGTFVFQPRGEHGEWVAEGVRLRFRSIPSEWGHHGHFRLELPAPRIAGADGDSLRIAARIVQGTPDRCWFGVRIPVPPSASDTTP